MNKEELFAHIEADQVAQLCHDLVRYKTINPPGDELALVNFVLEYLRLLGFEGELVPHAENRASGIARLRGSGELPALMFNGHADVVPVGNQPWRFDPFSGEIAEGKVWGRGSCDMKGGIAAMLVAARSVALTQQKLLGDLVFSITAGEEVNMLGARVLAGLPSLGPLQAIIISEPTTNCIALAERGVLWPEISTHGKTAHGSTPELGINAISMMLLLLKEIEEMEIPFTPHPLLGNMTRSLNIIQGGVQTNVVPDSCSVMYDFRTVPGQDHPAIIAQIEAVIQQLEQRVKDFKATVKLIHDLPPAETAPDHPAVLKFQAAASEALGKPVETQVMKFATEASIFVPALNVPTIVLGPGLPGLAHQPDEYVEIDKMVEAARIYALAAANMLG